MRKLTLAKLWLSSAVLNKRHISLHWICRTAMRVMSGRILRRTPRLGWMVMCMRLRFLARCRGNDYSVPVAYGHPLPGRACLHAREGRRVDQRLR